MRIGLLISLSLWLVIICFMAIVLTPTRTMVHAQFTPELQKIVTAQAEQFTQTKYLFEDIKDLDPVIVPLDDLTEGYLWDVPKPQLVGLIEAVSFTPAPTDLVKPPVVRVLKTWPTDEMIRGFQWSRSFTVRTSVPEPSTWMSLILGFGLMGICLRRARNLKEHA